MAYIVARNTGAWEIRESHSTDAGPRSRTLASFRSLTSEVIEHAQARSTKRLDPSELRKAAHRAGAPVTAAPSDRAAGDLLAQLAAGHRPRPLLARLLAKALSADGSQPTDNAEAAAAWIAASPARRGETLRDLLLLVDHLPRARTPERARFPRIASRAA
ncbi:MAG TPA: hypothetical protein VFV03_07255 [Solirubrobacteraceae bacterium]|nr:hypothetical protein [Solirubrobacteraceae bacterium]